jgi:glutaredoxin 3
MYERKKLMKITVFSTRTCPYCTALKSWLDDKGVEYANYNVDVNPVAAQQMLQVSEGQRGVPFSTIEHDDGSVDKILGFDRPLFEAALATK